MLRLMIRCGRKLSLPKNSRSLHSSTILHSEKKDGDKDVVKNEGGFDLERWEKERETENPFARTYRVLGKEWREMKNTFFFWREPRPVDRDEWGVDSANFPSHVDVVVIGSGAIADSVGYWLKRRAGESFSVLVLENEDKYTTTSKVLHGSGFQMQYTMDENIEMALFSSEFIREAQYHLGIDGEPPLHIPFNHVGSLTLATEDSAEQLEFNAKIQKKAGIKSILLTPENLKEKFPWINTDGIALGCLGLEREGWYDPRTLANAFKRKGIEMGVEYAKAEVLSFIRSKNPNDTISSGHIHDLYQKMNHVIVKNINGEERVIQFAILILAAGAETSKFARMMKIGETSGVLSVPLPIEPRKRYLYTVHVPDGPGINTPITHDPTGFYFRRHGLVNDYTVGYNPQNRDDEPTDDHLYATPRYFHDVIWPKIAHRVPSFESAQVRRSEAAFLDYNRYDETGILGHHPLYTNVLFATGFGHNSVNFSPAIGRAISELITRAGFVTCDFTRLGFERFITQEPQTEIKIF